MASPPRTIVHLDADCFFAAVEQASDPRLRGRPIAVGGEKRGIIASASYEARKFGVFTTMPTARGSCVLLRQARVSAVGCGGRLLGSL
ncbi:MAG: hypothetical protein KF791_20730 [Verrucomicrobiae bacterium]|nr:hypothetical protein [Verrucomicrobiae bacterium]